MLFRAQTSTVKNGEVQARLAPSAMKAKSDLADCEARIKEQRVWEKKKAPCRRHLNLYYYTM